MNTTADNVGGPATLLRELRDRDSETGLLTPSRLYRALLGEIARSGRYGNPLACVLVVIQGLAAADSGARLQLATKLADSMRNTDYAGTWDTDEFLLVLPETGESGARDFTNKVETVLTELASRLREDGSADVDVSTRIAIWGTGDDADAILGRLDTRTRAA